MQSPHAKVGIQREWTNRLQLRRGIDYGTPTSLPTLAWAVHPWRSGCFERPGKILRATLDGGGVVTREEDRNTIETGKNLLLVSSLDVYSNEGNNDHYYNTKDETYEQHDTTWNTT